MAEKGVFPRCQNGSFDVNPYVATTYGKRTAKSRFWYGRGANKCSNASKPRLRRRDYDDNRNSAAGAAGHGTRRLRRLGQPSGGGIVPPLAGGSVSQPASRPVSQSVNQSESPVTMITIENAKVETLGQHDARPVGKTVLSVTIGDHSFEMLVDESELIEALASQYA